MLVSEVYRCTVRAGERMGQTYLSKSIHVRVSPVRLDKHPWIR